MTILEKKIQVEINYVSNLHYFFMLVVVILHGYILLYECTSTENESITLVFLCIDLEYAKQTIHVM